MRKKTFMILIAGVLSLSFLLQANRDLSAATPMPRFSLIDAESGKMVDSVSFEGKAKLVIFFATWCPPCMREVPVLKQLQEEYGNEEFAVVGLSVDRRVVDVQRFLKRNNVNYSVLMADRAVAQGFGGIPGIPTMFLVNKKGYVLRQYQRMVPYHLLEREVKKMLAE